MTTEKKEIIEPKNSPGDVPAMLCAALLLIVSFSIVFLNSGSAKTASGESEFKVSNPLQSFVGKPGKWTHSPADAFLSTNDDKENDWLPIAKLASTFAILIAVLGIAIYFSQTQISFVQFVFGFGVVFLLAVLAYTMAAQSVVKAYNLEYALWALLVGLIVSNTIGTPLWIRSAVHTEFFIKTGLVLLGAEVLMSRLLALGLPGIFVAWVVTPIVLVSTYIFGQRVLKMESRSLNMVISADMSVCGVSAAIASAAACKAKKEELSLAIGMSLSFTVIMMVVMPTFIKAIGMNQVLGGAWMGGTIDSTGAVAAAGAALGEQAVEVAATVKMIQNILIGVCAFGIAVYWVSFVERDKSSQRPQVSEIWKRFPKFVIGFVLASILFSIIHATMPHGPELVESTIKGSTKTNRGWFFCLAFVCIGLETRFKDLLPYFRGGKPLVLYLCGQTFNIILTLAMVYLMFGVLFKDFLD